MWHVGVHNCERADIPFSGAESQRALLTECTGQEINSLANVTPIFFRFHTGTAIKLVSTVSTFKRHFFFEALL